MNLEDAKLCKKIADMYLCGKYESNIEGKGKDNYCVLYVNNEDPQIRVPFNPLRDETLMYNIMINFGICGGYMTEENNRAILRDIIEIRG